GPRLEFLSDPHGRRRQRHLLLTDELFRTCSYLRGKGRLVSGGELPAEHRLTVASPERALDHELVEVLDDILQVSGLSAPPCWHRGEDQIFAKQLAAETRQKCHDRRGLDHAGAERVCDGDVARARRL